MINRKFLTAVVLALVLITGLIVSCEGDADMFLRETDKVYIARVGLIGDDVKIINGGKSLSNTPKYIELDTDVIDDEEVLYQYFTGHPSTIIFQGIRTIGCEFDSKDGDDRFSKLSKIIFYAGDGDYPADPESICANAFYKHNTVDDATTTTGTTLKQVIFNSSRRVSIGDHAFGAYDLAVDGSTENGDVIIVVPNDGYVEHSDTCDDPDNPLAGNYRYFEHGQLLNSVNDVKKIYLVSAPGEMVNENDSNALIEYYKPSSTTQTVLISILPEKEHGRIASWVALTTASNHSDDLEGVTCTENVATHKWTIEIPGGVNIHFKLAVNKWIPDQDYSIITVDSNWPEWAKNSAANKDECSDGQIMIIRESEQAYFTSPTTIPKDVNGQPIAVWYRVTVSSPTNSSDIIFEERDGEWKLNTISVSPYTQNGSWVLDSRGDGDPGSDRNPIRMYAQWVPVANDIGVLFHYNFQDGTSKTSFAPQRAEDRKVVTPTDVQELIDEGRPGYVFTGWSYAENWLDTTTPFDFNTSDRLTTTTNVYAHWQTVDVDVAYNGNEQAHTVSRMDVVSTKTNLAYDSEIGAANITSPTRLGYRFDGWYSEPVGGVKIEADTAINSTNMPHFEFTTSTSQPRPMATVYAHWTPYKTTIKLYGHQTTLTDETMPDTDGEVVYEFDKGFYTSAIAVTTPTTGHMIDSFYDEWTTASNRVLDEFMMLVSGTDYVSATDNGVCVWVYCDSADNTLELHTIWAESKSFLLRFFRNWTTTETVLVDAQRIVKGEKTTATDTNAEWMKTGYNFMGWFTTKTTFSDLTPAEVDETRFDFTTSITDNYDLYALWDPITYNIEFEPMNFKEIGTDPIPASFTSMTGIRYDQEIVFDKMPKMDNYSFAGWTLVAGSEIVDYWPYCTYTNLTIIDGDTIWLYAVWDKSESGAHPTNCEVELFLGTTDESGKELNAYNGTVKVDNPRIIFTNPDHGQLRRDGGYNDSYIGIVSDTDLILRDNNKVQKFAGKHIEGFYSKPVGGVKILNRDLSFAGWPIGLEEGISEAYGYVGREYDDISHTFVYYWRGGQSVLFAHWE